jgi:hypothetical protein
MNDPAASFFGYLICGQILCLQLLYASMIDWYGDNAIDVVQQRLNAPEDERACVSASDLDAIEAEADGLARELDQVAFCHGVKVGR